MTHIKDENCIFCKIVAGEIPSYKIFEDNNFFGFLTIMPHVKGHMLLIPKNHVEDILSSDDTTSDEIFRTGKNLAKKIKNIFTPNKVGFVLAGQGVPHLHLHLIPVNQESDLNPEKAYKASHEELLEIQNLYNQNL
jgi:histidine triad (HIT) family protein